MAEEAEEVREADEKHVASASLATPNTFGREPVKGSFHKNRATDIEESGTETTDLLQCPQQN